MTYPKCWIWDSNRRKYKKDENGRSIGGALWREHWKEVEIIGETETKYITKYNGEVPKKSNSRCVFSLQELAKLAIIEHRNLIGETVRRCVDPEKLMQIANIVGYNYGDV